VRKRKILKSRAKDTILESMDLKSSAREDTVLEANRVLSIAEDSIQTKRILFQLQDKRKCDHEST